MRTLFAVYLFLLCISSKSTTRSKINTRWMWQFAKFFNHTQPILRLIINNIRCICNISVLPFFKATVTMSKEHKKLLPYFKATASAPFHIFTKLPNFGNAHLYYPQVTASLNPLTNSNSFLLYYCHLLFFSL